MRSSTDILRDLVELTTVDPIVTLINEYLGFPVAHEAVLQRVDGDVATLSVHKYQAVCMADHGETVLQSKLLSFAARARVITVRVTAGLATLADFSPAAYIPEQRRSVRARPIPPVEVEILVEGRSLRGSLVDVSARGMGIQLAEAGQPADLPALLHRGANLRIRFQLPTMNAPGEQAAEVRYSRAHGQSYAIGINLEAQAPLEAYMAWHAAAVERELRNRYQQLEGMRR